jgi:hypothetical protein
MTRKYLFSLLLVLLVAATAWAYKPKLCIVIAADGQASVQPVLPDESKYSFFKSADAAFELVWVDGKGVFGRANYLWPVDFGQVSPAPIPPTPDVKPEPKPPDPPPEPPVSGIPSGKLMYMGVVQNLNSQTDTQAAIETSVTLASQLAGHGNYKRWVDSETATGELIPFVERATKEGLPRSLIVNWDTKKVVASVPMGSVKETIALVKKWEGK